MKNILIPLLVFTTPIYAQNFQVGISGGLIQNSVHNNWVSSFWEQDADRFQARVITPDWV